MTCIAAIDGGWSEWSVGACSVTCGQGTATKTRTCTSPTPALGGATCQGHHESVVTCDTGACPGVYVCMCVSVAVILLFEHSNEDVSKEEKIITTIR